MQSSANTFTARSRSQSCTARAVAADELTSQWPQCPTDWAGPLGSRLCQREKGSTRTRAAHGNQGGRVMGRRQAWPCRIEADSNTGMPGGMPVPETSALSVSVRQLVSRGRPRPRAGARPLYPPSPVPPRRLERLPPAPEAGALSTELRGQTRTKYSMRAARRQKSSPFQPPRVRLLRSTNSAPFTFPATATRPRISSQGLSQVRPK